MRTLLMLMLATVVIQYIVWIPGVWRARRYTSLVVIGSNVILAGVWLLLIHRVLVAIVLYGLALHIFNLARIRKDRMHPKYLYSATLRTAFVVTCMQLAAGFAIALSDYYHLSAHAWLLGLAVLLVVMHAVLAVSVRTHIRQVNKSYPEAHFTDHDLPTVTVAIPARNETDDLTACLRSVLDTTYPKLEIIVLDDCSQQKRTPEIIKSFAHDGVRFLAGKPTPEHWLAKNYAYQQLLDASSGEYVLFCGVDVRFSSNTIRELVGQIRSRDKLMVSVMPINVLPAPKTIESLLAQPLRYAWELLLPRRRFGSPSVLSTCWIANRNFIAANGGFSAVARMTHPESYMARIAVRSNDSYSFIASSASLGLFCNKSLEEQQNTFIRTRYPQLHRRPEAVALLTLGNITIQLLPLPLFIIAVALTNWALAASTGIALLLAFSSYARVVTQTYRHRFLSSYVMQPLAVLYDVAVVHQSMYKYEFSEVIWKERNVCVPVMQVLPALPKLP